MSRKMIPVEESFAAWRKDPEYEKAYNALEEEFALAAAMIEARARAGLTQQQLAERMHTTQAVIARPRKRQGEAVDAHPRTGRGGDGPPAADIVRTDARGLNIP
jgi:ribosome-binding protein aMBF1 (putative translation factor)